MPSEMPANFCCRNPMSSSALNTMVVDDIQSIPPRNSAFISLNPKSRPARKPIVIMPITMVRQPTMAVDPTCSSFLNENSKPIEKRRKIIPISAQCSALSMSLIHDEPQTYGPTNKPATRYPSTTGCFRNLNRILTMPAVSIIMPRSCIIIHCNSLGF